MNYPTTINNLIECFKKLPGIGSKTAERLALATLNLPDEVIDVFTDSIKNVKTNTKRCKKCNSFCENDLCDVCQDEGRDHSTLCVVEDPKNVILFEKVGTYKGIYHVLDGLISPLDGITPDDINIESLLKRIKNDNINEVIIAVKPTIEGETTSLYISKLLEKEKVTVSTIAHGIPLGSDMEYMDSLTLEIAIQDRKRISENKE
ncbi:MAG: recombination protein RecR [Bacilli bacterium]|nr:recombination protein RecR [Bacilli bacterium]